MRYVYFARAMQAQTQTDVQTTDTNKLLHDTVVQTIRDAGCRSQFDIPVQINVPKSETASYIYRRDLHWLCMCSHLIAEVSHASIGVGYELAYAKHCLTTMPILCVAEQNASVSAMVAGWADVKRYDNLEELETLIFDWLTA